MDDLTRGGGTHGVVGGPGGIRTVREFVALLRHRKEASGLTYRQLELRAAKNGDVLARSTLAGALSREALPKADLLTAFVRACGVGEEEVTEWEAARERLAAGGEPGAGADTVNAEDAGAAAVAGPDPEADDGRTGAGGPRGATSGGQLRRGGKRLVRARRRALLLVGGVVVCAALLIVAVQAVKDDDGGQGGADVPAGAVTVRPVEGPDLCLSDGKDRAGRYDSLVAVFRSCANASPPVTELRATDDGRYRVHWYHPEHGPGCLVVRREGPPKGFLEPFDECGQGSPLRVERVRDTTSTYVLEVTDAQCVTAGAQGERPVTGVEAVVRPCDGSAGQRFVIRRTTAGAATPTAG
ncbi:XRE family transcriptional regulator [Streptomyces sp. NPDC016845]|uniref:XRE family transcriptional regulator n=1 Tax=Streptomyces sp. NPDC016845 TaxID=3364972 RepID=UPI0037A9A417